MKSPIQIASVLIALIAGTFSIQAEGLDAALQSKLDAKIKEAQTWATAPAIVKAVKEHNASLPADQAGLTQDKWKSLSILDPLVRSFTKNPAAEFLKSKKSPVIAEAFLSDAEGLKVAFLSKPSNWSHKGKAKHDVPMTGKTWQGSVELDDSTGQKQVQIAVPVLDGDKAIGSLVVGISISELEK